MTSRTTVSSLLALFTLSIVAAASCGGSGSSSSAPPPPKTTTSTSGGPVTSGGGEMSTSSGEGGTGGMGGAGGGGGATSCTDMLTNGGETDKDCGGPVCAPCQANFACKANADCASKNCDTSAHKCVADSCMDGLMNGKETDIDCGGGFCPGCGVAQLCNSPLDCKGGSCMGHSCAPSCSDGSKSVDLNETDVDCGGDTCPHCDTGLACNNATDCKNKVCTGNVCAPAKCTDTIQNGTETDIDCGGGLCSQCEAAQKCTQNNDCRSNSCVNLKCACPPGMQPVPKKLGGGSYCIDTTETTYAQYNVFYSANPANLTLPAGCAGAGSYTPAGNDWPAGPTMKEQQLPVSDVDWCDAVAYCLYSGKHLCGKVDGGPNDPASSTDPSTSEWFNACSAQGASAYPYGTMYDHLKCQGVDNANAAAPPGTCGANDCSNKVGYDLANQASLICQGGAPNIWGMSGNLAEWEDSCDTANPPNCLVRGGSRCEKGPSIACAAGVSQPRTYKGCDVGIRCCF